MRVPNVIQSEKQLQDALSTLFANSKNGKSFTGILELVASEHTIVTAIHNIKSNKGSKTAGTDGKTIDHYLQLPKPQILGMVRNQLNCYTPKPIRRKNIKKRNGKNRPLGIPCMMDRIIQECIRVVIEPILEARFHPHSYGFRPYRDCSNAVARTVNLMRGNNTNYVAIEGDIKGFFDHVNHNILIEKLKHLGIIDKRVLAIIKKMLVAKVLDSGELYDVTEGTPQGSILSPLLANAYLNDFDWTIGRKYGEPKNPTRKTGNIQRTLRNKGTTPVFLTRYADDWIVQTRNKKEAEKLLVYIGKYFKHRLKLELSEEKTVITDMREKTAIFLGFCIIAERRRKTPDNPKDTIVGKSYPNPKRVNEQLTKLREHVRKLGWVNVDDEWRILEIERLNAEIVGIANYWSSGIASLTFERLDYGINYTAYKIWRKRYGEDYQNYHVPIDNLINRQTRHKIDKNGKPIVRKSKTWAIPKDGDWIGITLASITPIQYGKLFNQDMTPYTAEGKLLYAKLRDKDFPLARPPLSDFTQLEASLYTDSIYNFEYMMNREYALNQTIRKGQFTCNVCGCVLIYGHRHCHHRNPQLPMDKINKVPNLVWVCVEDHGYITNGIPEATKLKRKQREKINKLRNLVISQGLGTGGPCGNV